MISSVNSKLLHKSKECSSGTQSKSWHFWKKRCMWVGGWRGDSPILQLGKKGSDSILPSEKDTNNIEYCRCFTNSWLFSVVPQVRCVITHFYLSTAVRVVICHLKSIPLCGRSLVLIFISQDIGLLDESKYAEHVGLVNFEVVPQNLL